MAPGPIKQADQALHQPASEGPGSRYSHGASAAILRFPALVCSPLNANSIDHRRANVVTTHDRFASRSVVNNYASWSFPAIPIRISDDQDRSRAPLATFAQQHCSDCSGSAYLPTQRPIRRASRCPVRPRSIWCGTSACPAGLSEGPAKNK